MLSSAPRALGLLVGFAVAFGAMHPAAAQDTSVNVYTTREPSLVLPLFQAFGEATGINVSAVYLGQGIAERLGAEGANSPADLVMMVDYGALINLVDRGLTQPVVSSVLMGAIPANLRDPGNHWFALSLRARVIYASVDRVAADRLTYEELADPIWRDRVCIRSGQHPYNTSLFAALIAKHGAESTEGYLAALRENLARTAGGGDRDGARDIFAGICDIAVGNSYYVGLMRSGLGGAEQREWADAIKVILPTFDDGLGTHVNISGAAVAVNAPHYDNAVRLLEFLLSAEAQEIYAQGNFEYPVRDDVPPDPIIAAFGQLRVDPLPLSDIAVHRTNASQLVDIVGFDN